MPQCTTSSTSSTAWSAFQTGSALHCQCGTPPSTNESYDTISSRSPGHTMKQTARSDPSPHFKFNNLKLVCKSEAQLPRGVSTALWHCMTSTLPRKLHEQWGVLKVLGTGAFFTVFLATRCGDSDSESDSEPDGPNLKFALLLVKVARDGQIKKPKRRSGPFKQVANGRSSTHHRGLQFARAIIEIIHTYI